MKKIIALTLIALLAFALCACGGSGGGETKAEAPADNPAAGTYTGVHSKFVGDTEWSEDEVFSLELKSDGTGTSTRDGASYDVTWKLDGENFSMTETFAGLTIDYTGTLKDGELHTYNGEPTDDFTYEYVYKK